MGLLSTIKDFHGKEENFHKLRSSTRLKNSLKYKFFFLFSLIIFIDSGVSINNYYHNKFSIYNSKIIEQETAILNHQENEELYHETLFSIVKELYGKEQFMTGGFEIPTEVSLEVLVGAIENATQNFKDALEATENYFNGRRKVMTQIPCIWPLQHSILVKVTSGHGYRFSPVTGKFIFHRGLDITGGEIDPKTEKYTAPLIIATADGIVDLHYLPPGWHNGKLYKGYVDEDGDDFGAYVVVKHGAMVDGEFVPNGYVTKYAHMDNTQLYVKEGMWVTQGTPLGEMGRTGNTTGLHVHYEIIRDKIHVNPTDYLVSMLDDNVKVVDIK
jgi:murein DD-endopeptidase MepM/ murein hydrolase activator NlpD